MITKEQFIQLRKSGMGVEEIKEMDKQSSTDLSEEETEKQGFFEGLGTGILKGIGGVGLGLHKAVGRGLQTILPKSVEETLKMSQQMQTVSGLQERIEPKTFSEQIGSTAVELGVLFAPTPIKGVGLPKMIAQSAPFLKFLNTTTKLATKGAMEFGTKEAILSGGEPEAIKRGVMFGAGGELMAGGAGAILRKVVPKRLPPEEAVLKPVPIKPRYIPKPRVSANDFPIIKEYASKNYKTPDLLKKNNIPSSSPEEAFRASSQKIEQVGKILKAIADKIKKPIDIKSVVNELEIFAKNQEKIGMKAKAKFARQIKSNIEFSQEALFGGGKISVSEGLKWRQLFDKAKFEDPAVAQIAKEVYEIAGNSLRKILNEIPEIGKLDKELNELFAIKDTMQNAIPQVAKIISKNEVAIEKAIQQSIQDNARQVEIYQQEFDKAKKIFEMNAWKLPQGFGPSQLVEFVNYFSRLIPQKLLQVGGVETGKLLYPTNTRKTQ